MNKKKANQKLAKEERQKKIPILNLSIIIIALLELIGQILNIQILRLIKPFPIILMICYISGKNSIRDHLLLSLVKSGLYLSLLGDVLLMFSDDAAFVFGTGFFFIAHILYILAFRIGEKVKEASPWQKSFTNFVILILSGAFIFNIYSLWDFFSIKWLFSMYGVVLCLMTIFALKRYQFTTTLSFWFILCGALLFAISDNVLAFLKFNDMLFQLGRTVVMATYYSGQFLIMHGALHHSNLQNQITKIMNVKNRSQFEEP